MPEQLEIEQDFQEAPPQGDPIDKLYKTLVNKGYYTKSFDEFKTKYSTPESIDKLFSVVSRDGLYTKSKDEFNSQYFQPVKKKGTGSYLGFGGFGAKFSDTQLPSNGQLKSLEERVKEYVYSNRTPEEIEEKKRQQIINPDFVQVKKEPSVEIDNSLSQLKPEGKAALQGLASMASSTFKFIGVAAKQLDFFNEYDDKKAEDLVTYKVGQWIEDKVKDLTGELSPEEQGMFSVKLAQGVGQMAGFVFGGLGAKALKMSPVLTAAGLGAAVGASSEYDNAIGSGATPEQAAKVFWLNGLIGTTEVLPIMGAFRKLDKYTGGLATGALARRLASTVGGRITNEAAQGFVTEASQEAIQQLLTNTVAANTYDATRKIYDDLLESAAIGGIIGSSMNAIVSTIRERRDAGGLTKEEDSQLAAAQKFAEEKAAEALDPNKKEVTTNTPNDPKVKSIIKAKTDIEADLASNTTLPEETVATMQSELETLDQELEIAKSEAYQEELNSKTESAPQSPTPSQEGGGKAGSVGVGGDVGSIGDGLKEKGYTVSDKGGFEKNGINVAWRSGAKLGVDKRGDVFNVDSPNKEDIVLQEIKVVDEAARGNNNASEVLKDFLEEADKRGYTVSLEPTPIAKYKNDKNLSKEKLISWYERHGFKKVNDYVWKRDPNTPYKETDANSDYESRFTKDEADRYRDAISKKEMTATEAKKEIERSGFPVPKDIAEQSLKEQPKAETPQNETLQTTSEDTQPVSPEEKSNSKKLATEAGDGAKEPPAGGKEDVVGGEDTPLKNKSLAKRLVEAKNTPEAAKKGIEKEGLKYKPHNQEEAEAVAKSIIDELGIDEALKQAQAQNFGGDVNTLIQTESLNRLYDEELAAKTSEEKFSVAEKFADIAIKLDEWARDKAGRGIAALNYFYKKSPLGMIIKQNKENKKDFDKWAKGKDESWDDFLERLNEQPEFKEYVSKEVQEGMKKERAESRKGRIKKVDDTIDGWIKDIQDGKALFALPVPPPVLIAALKGAKKAYRAGEHISKIIQDAIDYITEAIKDSDWNSEGLRKKLEALYGGEKKNSLDRYKDNLNRQIADLDRQIENRKRDNKKKNKTELDDEAKSLVEKRNEKKKQLEEIAPLSETEEYQLRQLEKFRKKLKGLTESQKDEVIRKSFQELIKSGALKQEDFRKIIAQATGRGDLTAEQSAKMKELVAHTNAVEVFAKRLQERKTTQSLGNYQKSQIRAAKAARELSDMFDKKADYLKVIAASVQGNTLSLTNIAVLNPLFNIVNQLSTRLPIGALQSLYGIMSGKAQFNTALSASTQKQFFKELWKGLKEANVQLVTGMNRLDYDAKEIFTDQIRPFKSARELWHQVRSSEFGNTVARMMGKEEVERKEQLTARQKVHRALQIAPGTTAELIFRLLNYGDKPMRFGAGGATAAAFANSLGIKTGTMDWDIFLEFPREEAYRILKSQGKTEKEASEKADYIKESILQEGKRSTFQQDNLFTDAINRVFGGGKKAESGAASLAKASLVSPYIKIPSNAFWSYFNIAHPLIAVAQSTGHLINSKRLRSNGENVKADLQIREARYWAGHAAVGIALNMVIIPLVKAGIISASSDEDDPKKEREGERTYQQQGTINIGGTDIPLRYFGSLGMLANSIAKDYEEMTPEQRESRDLLLMNLFEFWDTDDLKELQNSIFSNSAGLLRALGEGGTNANRFLINQINMYANLIHPAAVAQFSRAEMPYYTTRKADTFLKELDNSLLERSSLYRSLSGKYPPTKYNIWGDEMKKDDNFWFRVLGISRTRKDTFAQPIWEDYKKSKDTNFFPPAVSTSITVDGVKKKMNADQQRKFERVIGQQRKELMTLFVNGGTTITDEEGNEVKYSEIKNEKIKIKLLQKIYKQGYKQGKILFQLSNPDFMPQNPENAGEDEPEDG